jgi:peptidoglycan/xylan/chitin deacetylase (PgdA/CDA1 family)
MGTVCLTFDVDAEAGLAARLEDHRDRLSTLSEREFSVRRGVLRILELLGEHGMRATFYVPGATAQRHPDAIRAIVDAGHEVGHHGHHHLASHTLDAEQQAAEIDDALTALRPFIGDSIGYRSPAWELTPQTAELLVARGFAFDSSLMADDRPYRLTVGEARLIELPIHWSLDDYVWFGWGEAARPTATSAWLEAWTDELASADSDDRPCTLTFHPEIIGRGYRALGLARLLKHLADTGAEALTHAELAARV